MKKDIDYTKIKVYKSLTVKDLEEYLEEIFKNRTKNND